MKQLNILRLTTLLVLGFAAQSLQSAQSPKDSLKDLFDNVNFYTSWQLGQQHDPESAQKFFSLPKEEQLNKLATVSALGQIYPIIWEIADVQTLYNKIAGTNLVFNKFPGSMSNALVPFSKKDISNWQSRTIASFFDTQGNLKKDDLYGYLGSGKIAANRTTIFADDKAGEIRIPIFVKHLLSSKDEFFANGGTQKQFNEFMNALLLHGNMSTHRLCLIPGASDTTGNPCPCCKFKPDLLLPLFVEAVQEDDKQTSRMKNNYLAAIILNFITYQVVQGNDEIRAVEDFIKEAALNKAKNTEIKNINVIKLDLSVRSLRALLSYAIYLKKGTAASINDLSYKNAQDTSEQKALKDALHLAHRLTQKFKTNDTVNVGILQNQTYLNQVEEYKKILPERIKDLEKTLQEAERALNLASQKKDTEPSTLESLKNSVTTFKNQFQDAKSDKLYYETSKGGALFYYKYLKEYRERIHEIAQLLTGDNPSERQEKVMLLQFAQDLHDLIPDEAVGITETQEESKAGKINKGEFGSTVSTNPFKNQQPSSSVSSLLPKNQVPAAKKRDFVPANTSTTAAEAAQPAATEKVAARAAGASELDTSVRGDVGGARALFESGGKKPVAPVITTVSIAPSDQVVATAPAKKTPPAVPQKTARSKPAATPEVVAQPAAAAMGTMPEADESVVDNEFTTAEIGTSSELAAFINQYINNLESLEHNSLTSNDLISMLAGNPSQTISNVNFNEILQNFKKAIQETQTSSFQIIPFLLYTISLTALKNNDAQLANFAVNFLKNILHRYQGTLLYYSDENDPEDKNDYIVTLITGLQYADNIENMPSAFQNLCSELETKMQNHLHSYDL